MKISYKHIRSCALLILILLLLAIAPAAFAGSVKATINTSSAKVYQNPSTSSASVKAVKGISVTVTDYSNGWAKISYKGRTGYIRIDALNLSSRISAYTFKQTNVYSSASASSAKLMTLTPGTKVYVAGINGGYARIQNKSGSVTGFIKINELASKEQAEAAYHAYGGSSSSSKLSQAVKLAISFSGRPYGSNEPSSFNCSSLISYCYGKYGFRIKDSAASIAADTNLKKITSYSDCKAGDILCFDSDGNKKCDHVAIYIGNGRFVEASQNAGIVQVNSVSSWYKSHFMWARRV